MQTGFCFRSLPMLYVLCVCNSSELTNAYYYCISIGTYIEEEGVRWGVATS